MRAKRFGFSDSQIAEIMGVDTIFIRQMRKKLGIIPYVKRIDTLAAEWPATTNYLYLTYSGSEHDIDFEKEKRAKKGDNTGGGGIESTFEPKTTYITCEVCDGGFDVMKMEHMAVCPGCKKEIKNAIQKQS